MLETRFDGQPRPALHRRTRGRSRKRARPKRGLPIAPNARPGARNLPLAAEAREIDRRHRPIYAVWEITLACDLACRHCGSRAGRDRPDELSTAEALDLVDQLADLGVKEVTLIGGEAYLRPDWLEIVRKIRARGMICSTTSGGRGLTREIVTSAASAGLGARISIDGDEATHDRLRGVAGSYRAAFAAMRAIREQGLRLSCNTQINRLSTRIAITARSKWIARVSESGSFGRKKRRANLSITVSSRSLSRTAPKRLPPPSPPKE